MKHSRINKMALQPDHAFDINELVKWVTIVSGAVLWWWKYIDNKFKEKKLEIELAKRDKEEFITRVAESAVKAALNSMLGEVKEDIQTLFKYREDDRKHIDKKFEIIMVEMRK